MKFVCSLLFLAGIIIFNDALPSIDNHMDLLNEEQKLLLTKLRQKAQGRRSIQTRDIAILDCNDKYMEETQDMLTKYNSAMDTCNSNKKLSIQKLTEIAEKTIKEFKDQIKPTCEEKCPNETASTDKYSCLQKMASNNTQLYSAMGIAVAAEKVQHDKNMEDTKGIAKLCNSKAKTEFQTKQMDLLKKYEDCDTFY